MLFIKIKNFLYNNRYTICLFISLFLYAADAFADVQYFSSLDDAGQKIFRGLRKIIYPAATIGIASVCIAGMFGSFNWKWLIAILLGVFIITYASMVGGMTGADMSGID